MPFRRLGSFRFSRAFRMPCRTISTMAPLPSPLPCSGAPAASGRLKDICETYLSVSLRSPNAGSPAWQTRGSVDVPHAESAPVQLGGALEPLDLPKSAAGGFYQ